MARCRPHMVDDCPYCKEAAQVAAQYPENCGSLKRWGGAFHREEDCYWLQMGLKKVRNPTPVIAVTYKQAKARDKEPCKHCFPPFGRPTAKGRGPRSPAGGHPRLEFSDREESVMSDTWDGGYEDSIDDGHEFAEKELLSSSEPFEEEGGGAFTLDDPRSKKDPRSEKLDKGVQPARFKGTCVVCEFPIRLDDLITAQGANAWRHAGCEDL